VKTFLDGLLGLHEAQDSKAHQLYICALIAAAAAAAAKAAKEKKEAFTRRDDRGRERI
jgi:hypothetical protein